MEGLEREKRQLGEELAYARQVAATLPTLQTRLDAAEEGRRPTARGPRPAASYTTTHRRFKFRFQNSQSTSACSW